MASPQSWNAHFSAPLLNEIEDLYCSKSWHFEASEDIKKIKSQALHFIRIEYWNTYWCKWQPSIPHSHPMKHGHFNS